MGRTQTYYQSITTIDSKPIIIKYAGAKIAAFQLPSLPGGGSGLPIQFVIKTTDTFTKLK